MFHHFQYEAGFCTDPNRLPLYARMKLDIAGIKLSLNQWLAFALEERRVIGGLPIENDAADGLCGIRERSLQNSSW